MGSGKSKNGHNRLLNGESEDIDSEVESAYGAENFEKPDKELMKKRKTIEISKLKKGLSVFTERKNREEQMRF